MAQSYRLLKELAQMRPSPAIEREGWLATRSSLMNAGERRVVDQMFASWNRIASWLRQIDGLNRSRYKSTCTSPALP